MASLGGELDADDPCVASEMGGTLRHRGPDDSGSWHDHRVALAHRRLAIIDLTDAGAQPMVSHSGRHVLAFNGEIYDHRELAKQLTAGGWQPKGSSDTEVLLAAFEAWGVDRTLDRVDGMFALALYDREAARLVLARDRFGEKPLAYGVHAGRLYFASELRAFAEVPGFDLRLDSDATADFFRYGYVPGSATIFGAIRRLGPADLVEVDLTTRTVADPRSYWQVPGRPAAAGTAADDGDLVEQLSASVRDRLVSDRPIGALLSGGIDSSLVCALAAQHTTGALKTFTMGWDDAEYDESAQAASVARALGADHHDVRLGRADAVAAATRLGSVMDEPFADPSQLGVLLVATEARRHVVVALSGDGGDELFAGYNRHRWLLNLRRTHARTPGWLRRPSARVAHRAAPLVERMLRPIPPQRRPRLVADKVRKLAGVAAAPDLPSAYQSLLAQSHDVGSARHLAPAARAALGSADDDAFLWGVRAADLQGFLPDAVLTKVDRATMSVSLESRTPFLQPQLATAAMGRGVSDLLGPSGGKQPLRGALGRLLPGVAFDQTKTGFGVPTAGLMRAELRGTLHDAVSDHTGRQGPVELDWPRMLRHFDRGSDEPAPLLWSLLMFELWAKEARHGIAWA